MPISDARITADIGFQSPVLCRDRIVFSDRLSNGLLCISAETGKKLWEIRRRRDFFTPWVGSGGELLVFSDKTISQCNIVSGELKPVYQSDLLLSPIANWTSNDPQLIVAGARGEQRILLSIDATTFREAWRQTNFIGVLAMNTNTICLIQGSSPVQINTWGDLGVIDAKVSAMDRTGRPKWTRSLPREYNFEEGLALDSYFLLPTCIRHGVKELRCYRQDDGTIVSSHSFGSEADSVGVLLLANYENRALALTSYRHGNLTTTTNLTYIISMPSLQVKPLFATENSYQIAIYRDVLICSNPRATFAYDISTARQIWRIGFAKFSGISGGAIYCATREETGAIEKVYRVDVVSGERRTLFERTLRRAEKRQEN